ncbi:MAG: methionyl-tRNA formyltransferase [Suipraeoptans sp.]
MKVIFMGTPEFSVGTLQAIIEAGHEVVLCVTQPDKPKGRGKEMTYTPVKEEALKHGIPIFQPFKIREEKSISELEKYEADVCVVVAFGQIIPKEVLEMTRYGCINVHASLLPKYRGAAPIQWAIIDGESATGVTTMQMDEGLDTGDMLLKTVVPISSTETSGTLHDKLSDAGAKLLIKTLEDIKNGNVKPEKQGETTTEYAAMIHKSMGNINWNDDATKIERLIRAMSPWPSAYTNWHERVIKIWEANVIEKNTDALQGTVIRVDKNSFSVQTGEGTLEIKSVQLPGKKRVDADAFLRGHKLVTGTVLGK